MKKIILILVALSASSAFAAVPSQLSMSKAGDLKTEQVKMTLRLPYKNRVQVLKSWNKKAAEKKLTSLAFDSKQSLQMRWRSVTALSQVNPNSPAIERALQSKEWFMRNSGLIALKKAPRDKVVKWTKKLLKDPALVVRTASVQLIQDRKLTEVEPELWSALKSSDNFRKGQSLWVRTSIADALASFGTKKQQKRFVSLLSDSDTRLHPIAIEALEKTARLKTQPKTLSAKRAAWIEWSKSNIQ